MHAIENSWVEKLRKKKIKEVAPAYESYVIDDFEHQTRKPKKRHTPSLNLIMNRTLRGVRR